MGSLKKHSKKKQAKIERKKKQIERALLVLSLRKWTIQEIINATNHANNEAKAKGEAEEISPGFLETLIKRLSLSESQVLTSTELMAIFGPGYIDGAVVLLDHLYANWSNEIDADDLHQMAKEESFTSGRFQKNIKH